MKHKKMGNVIKNIRLHHHATIRQFAYRLGIHSSTLHRYESGSKAPSRRVLEKVQRIAGVDSIQELVRVALN